jgi:hypothetical protein
MLMRGIDATPDDRYAFAMGKMNLAGGGGLA